MRKALRRLKKKLKKRRKYKQRKPFERKNDKILTAFIPGTIKEVFVKPKAKVSAGDKLFVLEAMKMENNIASPIDGKIKSLHIVQGDRVRKDQLLLEFE